LAVAAAVALFIARTRLGKMLRAAADNPEAATYMGIHVGRAYRLAFGIGAAVTAVAGGLVATYYPFQPYNAIEFVIVMYAGVDLSGCILVRGGSLLPADGYAGADLGDRRGRLESFLGIVRIDVVRPRRFLRHRRVHGRAPARQAGPEPLVRHRDRRVCRGARRSRDRLSDVQAARTLFRARDARLPACASLCVRVARIPGGRASHESRDACGFHAVFGSAHLCAARGSAARHRTCHQRGGGALAVRTVAARDQTERAGGNGG